MIRTCCVRGGGGLLGVVGSDTLVLDVEPTVAGTRAGHDTKYSCTRRAPLHLKIIKMVLCQDLIRIPLWEGRGH